MIVSVSIPLDIGGNGVLRVDPRSSGWNDAQRIVAVYRHGGVAAAGAPPSFDLVEGKEQLVVASYLPTSVWTELDHVVEGGLALRIDVSGGTPSTSEYLTFQLS